MKLAPKRKNEIKAAIGDLSKALSSAKAQGGRIGTTPAIMDEAEEHIELILDSGAKLLAALVEAASEALRPFIADQNQRRHVVLRNIDSVVYVQSLIEELRPLNHKRSPVTVRVGLEILRLVVAASEGDAVTALRIPALASSQYS